MDLNTMAEKYPELDHLLRTWRIVIAHAEGDGMMHEWLVAEVLSVSLGHARRLMASGEIPAVLTDLGLKVRYPDLIAYKRERDAQREAGLRRMTAISQGIER